MFSTPNASKVANNSTYILQNSGDLVVKHAAILWSNFAGEPTRVNPAGGKRTFNLVLTEEVGNDLKAAGWNVKFREPREEGDDPLVYTEIVVNMESTYPPTIHLCTDFNGRKSRTELNADDVSTLDRMRFTDISVMVHPFEHGRTNSAGATVKGYLRSMDLVAENTDIFAEDYAEYMADDEVPFA